MTNWSEYNEALRRRGDVTIGFAESAIYGWRTGKTGAMHRPREYFDAALKLLYCSVRSFIYRYARPKV